MHEFLISYYIVNESGELFGGKTLQKCLGDFESLGDAQRACTSTLYSLLKSFDKGRKSVIITSVEVI